MNISNRPFGTLTDGKRVTCWTLRTDEGMQVELLDYGATIRSIVVPDRNGLATDVVLGYDTIEGYTGNRGFYGATIGRFANRIGGAAFVLNGTTYRLAKNSGENHLHGGVQGFDKRMWESEPVENGICFRRVSENMEEGYPGRMQVSVTFTAEKTALRIRYEAQSDRDTIVNLTNHSYFNLNGGGDVQGQLLQIRAESCLVNDPQCLPTGEIADVAGTAMDFRTPHAIGERADSGEECVRYSRGYDANYCLSGNPAATAMARESGIVLTVTTTQPGLQLYTANHMAQRTGKGGQIYGHRAAFCLETQHFPDCIHHPDWPNCVLRAGERFESTTVYAFSVNHQI